VLLLSMAAPGRGWLEIGRNRQSVGDGVSLIANLLTA
jgi:hypothetical protein